MSPERNWLASSADGETNGEAARNKRHSTSSDPPTLADACERVAARTRKHQGSEPPEPARTPTDDPPALELAVETDVTGASKRIAFDRAPDCVFDAYRDQ